MQILVVEDHEDTRQVLERLCSRSGFNVFSAATLQEGLHFLETTPFDAIISDIACSAVVMALPNGVFITMMPR